MNDPNLDQKRLTHLYQCLKMTLIALVATLREFNAKLKIGIAATAVIIGTTLILAAEATDIGTELVSTPWCWGDFDEPSLRVAGM